MEDNYLIVREYEERIADSQSEKYPEFISFEHINGSFYFAWIKHGKVFLRSEGYASAPACDNGMLSVLKNGSDKNNYRTTSAHGAHFLYLVADNNKEIARSNPMKEEVEAFIALGLINEIEANIAPTMMESRIHEEELPQEEEIVVTKEELLSETSIESESTVTTDLVDVEKTTIESEEIQTTEPLEPQKEESEKKLLSSPLLDSFQKEVGIAEVEAIATTKEEIEEPEKAETTVTTFHSQAELDLPNASLEEPVSATLESPEPSSEALDMETRVNNLYMNMENEGKTKLGVTYDEEEKDSKKGTWRWLLWLLLMALIAALLWWLFQMDGCYKIRTIDPRLGGPTADSANNVVVQERIQADTSLKLDSASRQAKATWQKTLGNRVALRLPDGSLINVPENGTEKRLVEYLDAKCGTSELKKTWFDMDRILFESGTDELKEISEEQIILLAKIFKSYPNKKFKIGGYTDNIGNPETNIRLSAIRAAAALRAIAAIGIDSTRMRYEGYGQEHPLCPTNDTEECRAKNRRVSIRVDFCN